MKLVKIPNTGEHKKYCKAKSTYRGGRKVLITLNSLAHQLRFYLI